MTGTIRRQTAAREAQLAPAGLADEVSDLGTWVSLYRGEQLQGSGGWIELLQAARAVVNT